MVLIIVQKWLYFKHILYIINYKTILNFFFTDDDINDFMLESLQRNTIVRVDGYIENVVSMYDDPTFRRHFRYFNVNNFI